MITAAEFYGRGQHLTPGADFDVTPQIGRAIAVNASAGSLKGSLPPATRWPVTGGAIAYVLNIGSNAFDLADNGGTVIKNIAANKAVVLCLLNNTSANGQWMAITYDILS